jgi:hypothetical protein
MRGRKTKQESRSAELRQRLIAWKQTPESLRPSLRALARILGTSAPTAKALPRWAGEVAIHGTLPQGE